MRRRAMATAPDKAANQANEPQPTAASSAAAVGVVWAMRAVDAAAKTEAQNTMVSGLEAVAIGAARRHRPARAPAAPG